VQAVRVTDPQVLEVPVERLSTPVQAAGGFRAAGSSAVAATPPAGATIFAVNHNADTALLVLRYRLREADIQVAEEPFEAEGVSFGRGSFLIRNAAADALATAARELGIVVHPLSSAPAVATHPARAARVALMHTWQRTQTEGWWRHAFDTIGLPYDYISTQDVARDANLRARYDVIMFAPGGGSGIGVIEGMPMFRDPIPWKKTELTPNIGVVDETDDMRPGLGWEGLQNLRRFIEEGGVYIGAGSAADFAIEFGLTRGVTMNSAGTGSRVVGSLLRSKLVDAKSPIAYGYADDLALYSDGGESFSVSAGAGGGGRGGRGGGGNQRATGRGTPDDVDTPQGRPALDPRFMAPERPTVQPWEYAIPTEEQLRNPLNVIPPEFRPRVVVRFADQRELLVSGLLQGGGGIAQRPVVVDVPMGQGHAVLFANNPVWRGSTVGSYFLVFNAILNFDNLNAGRTLDPR
jgi:hypothetical protein